MIVSGSLDGTVRVWDAASGTLVGEPLAVDPLRDFPDNVFAVDTAQLDGSPVVIVGSSHGLRTWDLATHQLLTDP